MDNTLKDRVGRDADGNCLALNLHDTTDVSAVSCAQNGYDICLDEIDKKCKRPSILSGRIGIEKITYRCIDAEE